MKKYILLIVCLSGAFSALAQTGGIDIDEYNKAVEFYHTGREDYENKNFESAISNFSKAYQINTSDSDIPFSLAISYYELKAYDSAKKYIEIAIVLEPDHPDFHYRAGNIYFHSKAYQSAVKNYELALSNQNDEFPINMDHCYYNKAVSEYYLKDYAAAVKDLSVLINNDDENDSYLHLRGVSYLRLKKNAEGCADLKKAHELGNPNSERYLGDYCK